MTVYASQPIILSALLLLPVLLLLSLPRRVSQYVKAKPPRTTADDSTEVASSSSGLPRRAFLTTYRGSMMAITCIAILAVDFHAFPRRFAKVETWGTSLMDLGVGSFVYSAGVVAARPVIQSECSSNASGLLLRLRASLRHALPLLFLGLVRLYSVKGLDYAEHVTEYGVHWNFFFTLALLPPFVAIFQSLFSLIPSYYLLSLLLGTAYQIILESTLLQPFILTSPRTSLLSQNREGVFSFIGYLSIFLAGLGMGMDILRPNLPLPSMVRRYQRSIASSPSNPFHILISHPTAPMIIRLSLASTLWLLLFCISHSIHGASLAVSRRLANLSYILWVNAFNSGQLLVYCILDSVFFTAQSNTRSQRRDLKLEYKTSRILAAFNRNGLAIFLFANLLTGIVNLTMPTLELQNLQAMAVLITYAAAISIVALVLDSCNISIKL